MCESAAHPGHGDGMLGDLVTFLLTSNYAGEETGHQFSQYRAAQAGGQVGQSVIVITVCLMWVLQLTGECGTWTQDCPISFFGLIDQV